MRAINIRDPDPPARPEVDTADHVPPLPHGDQLAALPHDIGPPLLHRAQEQQATQSISDRTTSRRTHNNNTSRLTSPAYRSLLRYNPRYNLNLQCNTIRLLCNLLLNNNP